MPCAPAALVVVPDVAGSLWLVELVLLGLAVAFSALWMTQFYPRQPGTGTLVYLFRLAFGSGMAGAISLAVAVAEYIIRPNGGTLPRTTAAVGS